MNACAQPGLPAPALTLLADPLVVVVWGRGKGAGERGGVGGGTLEAHTSQYDGKDGIIGNGEGGGRPPVNAANGEWRGRAGECALM